jgi:hypothetical protein
VTEPDVRPTQSVNGAAADPLSRMVAQARAALDGRTPETAPDPGPYVGTAADGLVRAEVDADGTVRSVTLDPQMFKRPLVDVAAAARVAVNAALDARPGRVDLAPVIAQVRAAQEQARRDLSAITQGLADVERSVRAAREGNH